MRRLELTVYLNCCVQKNVVDRLDDKVASTGEVFVPDASEVLTVAAEIEKRPFYFLPTVPRYDDEKLAEQLKHAEEQVDQKTQSRDALRADIQKIRVRNAFEIFIR